MYLARKITRAKWEDGRTTSRGLAKGEISADAVTGDLRTRQDTLSFWRCGEGANADIADAVLAIAAAGERVDRIDIVWVDYEALLADGQTLKQSPGRTPFLDFADHHVDFCQLDYVRLGRLAQRVDTAIREERWRRVTKARVKVLLTKALQQGRILHSKLDKRLQMDIER